MLIRQSTGVRAEPRELDPEAAETFVDIRRIVHRDAVNLDPRVRGKRPSARCSRSDQQLGIDALASEQEPQRQRSRQATTPQRSATRNESTDSAVRTALPGRGDRATRTPPGKQVCGVDQTAPLSSSPTVGMSDAVCAIPPSDQVSDRLIRPMYRTRRTPLPETSHLRVRHAVPVGKSPELPVVSPSGCRNVGALELRTASSRCLFLGASPSDVGRTSWVIRYDLHAGLGGLVGRAGDDEIGSSRLSRSRRRSPATVSSSTAYSAAIVPRVTEGRPCSISSHMRLPTPSRP